MIHAFYDDGMGWHYLATILGMGRSRYIWMGLDGTSWDAKIFKTKKKALKYCKKHWASVEEFDSMDALLNQAVKVKLV